MRSPLDAHPHVLGLGSLPLRTPRQREILFHLVNCQECLQELFRRLLRRQLTAGVGLHLPGRIGAFETDALRLQAEGLTLWRQHAEIPAVMQQLYLSSELFAEAENAVGATTSRLLLGLLFAVEHEPESGLWIFQSTGSSAASGSLHLFAAYAAAFCLALLRDLRAAHLALEEAREMSPEAAGPEAVPHLLWLESRTALLLGEDDHMGLLESLCLDFCQRGDFEEAFLSAVDLATERAARGLRSSPLLEQLDGFFGRSEPRARLIAALETAALPEAAASLYLRLSSSFRLRPLLDQQARREPDGSRG